MPSHILFFMFLFKTPEPNAQNPSCTLYHYPYVHTHTRAHSKPWKRPDDKLQLFPELFIDLWIYFQGKEIKHQDRLFWNCSSFSKITHITLHLQTVMSREKPWQTFIARFFTFLPCQTFLTAEVAVLSSAEYAVFWMEIEPPFFEGERNLVECHPVIKMSLGFPPEIWLTLLEIRIAVL